MSWDVYCAVLPARWHARDGAVFSANGGGQLGISYEAPNGAALVLNEGAYCLTGAASCAPHDDLIGPAAFGDLVGTLYAYQGGFALYVRPGTSRAYSLTGSGVSEATFRSIALALYKVPSH